jgi:hypothetical protein
MVQIALIIVSGVDLPFTARLMVQIDLALLVVFIALCLSGLILKNRDKTRFATCRVSALISRPTDLMVVIHMGTLGSFREIGES